MPTLFASYPSTQVSQNTNSTTISKAVPNTSGAGLIVVAVTGNGGNNDFPFTVSGAGLTWTKIKGSTWLAGQSFPGAGTAEIWAAWASSALTSQTITATRGFNSGSMMMAVYAYTAATVVDGSSSITASFGATGGKQQDGSTSIDATLNGTAAGSELIVALLDGTIGTGLTAISTPVATAFDITSADATIGCSMAAGRTTTSPGGTVTLGATNSNTFMASASVEVLAAAGSSAIADAAIWTDHKDPEFLYEGNLYEGGAFDAGESWLWDGIAQSWAPPPDVVPTDVVPEAAQWDDWKDPEFLYEPRDDGFTSLWDGAQQTSPIPADVVLVDAVPEAVQWNEAVDPEFLYEPPDDGMTAWGWDGAGPAIVPASKFPLTIDSTGRFLRDAQGTPFRIRGEAAWLIPTQLTTSQASAFLDQCVSQGINTLIVMVLNHDYESLSGTGVAPQNTNGDLPFTLNTSGTAYTGTGQLADFSTPNSAYFAGAGSAPGVDGILSMAYARNILVLLAPAYLGFSSGAQGWTAELSASGVTKCTSYGTFLGNRYKTQPNIIWLQGGDNSPGSGGAIENAAHAVMDGIVAAGDTHFHTGHWSQEHISTDQANFAASMSLESVYTYGIDTGGSGHTFLLARTGYSHIPAMPTYLVETGYEGEHNVGLPGGRKDVRAEQWWAVLSAIGGEVAGNFLVWPQNGGYNGSSGILSPLHTDLKLLGQVLDSVAWFNLVPSLLGSMQRLVTSSNGDPNAAGDNYAAAAACPDGTLLMCYLPPTASLQSITVAMSAMGGSTLARWWDPTTGSFTADSSGLANSGTHVFTPPSNNSGGDTDWVLVLTAPAFPNEQAATSWLWDAIDPEVLYEPPDDGEIGWEFATWNQAQASAALAASIQGVGTLGATLTTGIPLAASFAGSSTMTAALTTGIQLATGFVGTGTLGASLTTAIQLAANISGQGVLTASLNGAVAQLAADIHGSASMTADLTASTGFRASVAGIGVLGANLTTAIQLAAAFAGSSLMRASLGTGESTAIIAIQLRADLDVDHDPHFQWDMPAGDAETVRISVFSGGAQFDCSFCVATLRVYSGGSVIFSETSHPSGPSLDIAVTAPDTAGPGAFFSTITIEDPAWSGPRVLVGILRLHQRVAIPTPGAPAAPGPVSANLLLELDQPLSPAFSLAVFKGSSVTVELVARIDGVPQGLSGSTGVMGTAAFGEAGVLSADGNAYLFTMRPADLATLGTFPAMLSISSPNLPGPRSILGSLIVKRST